MGKSALPGDPSSMLHITLDSSLSSNIKEPPAPEHEGEWTFHVRERCRVHGSRTIRLPLGIDTSKIAARVCDGVLTITCPKLVPGAVFPTAARTRIPVA